MTNWVPESRLEPAVGHAAHRFRGIGYPKFCSPVGSERFPRRRDRRSERPLDRGVHGGIVHRCFSNQEESTAGLILLIVLIVLLMGGLPR